MRTTLTEQQPAQANASSTESALVLHSAPPAFHISWPLTDSQQRSNLQAVVSAVPGFQTAAGSSAPTRTILPSILGAIPYLHSTAAVRVRGSAGPLRHKALLCSQPNSVWWCFCPCRCQCTSSKVLSTPKAYIVKRRLKHPKHTPSKTCPTRRKMRCPKRAFISAPPCCRVPAVEAV